MQNISCAFMNATMLATNKSCVPTRPRGSSQPYNSETYVLTAIVLLSILIPVIVLGNSFVILAFATTRRLRTTTYYFVVSLALADFLVGALSLPIFTVAIHQGRKWRDEHPSVIKLWTSIDMITTVASIVNLMYISIDRFVCIQFPFHYYAMLAKRKVLIMIAMSWLYGLLNAGVVLLTYKKGRARPSVLLSITIMAFIIPLLVILVMYSRVMRIALSHRIRMSAREEKQDKEKAKRGTMSLLRELKATRTLAVVVAAFVLCFVGYFVLLLRIPICNKWVHELNCKPFPNETILVISLQWIKYFNSCLNPFIYGIMDGNMRKALKRFVKGKILASSESSSLEMR